MPPAQAQSQAQRRSSRSSTSRPSTSSSKAADQRKQLDQKATDPRLTHLRDDLEHDQRRREGHAAARQLGGHRGGPERDADDRALRPGHRAARAAPARRHDPDGDQGREHDRRRRRHDRRLRRPRRRDLQPAGPHDRRRRRAQLPAADARVPLGRDPADRRADEPHLDRRRVRRRDRGVREGLGRQRSSASTTRSRSSASCR